MKWNKFHKLATQYPFLAHDLVWRGSAPSDIKQFVREKVGFIAFRPFEALDLSSKSTSSSTPLKSQYRHTQMESYQVVEYQLNYHVDADGTDGCGRLGYVTPSLGDGSIQAHIDDTMEWLEECDVFKGKQLVWERVVKRTTRGSSHSGLTSMNLEVYLFPRGYRFRSLPCAAPLPVDPAYAAYVRGEPMPPIIPQTPNLATS